MLADYESRLYPGTKMEPEKKDAAIASFSLTDVCSYCILKSREANNNMTYFNHSIDDAALEAALEKQSLCNFCVEDGAPTNETLADWKQAVKAWRKLETVEEETLAGFPALLVQGQPAKGVPSKDVVVIDAGAFRVVYMA